MPVYSGVSLDINDSGMGTYANMASRNSSKRDRCFEAENLIRLVSLFARHADHTSILI